MPVSPKDRHLLGVHWMGEVFMDMALPFGLRSAPLLFTALADAVQWAVQCRDVTWLDYYIDGFFMVGGPNSQECAHNVSIMREMLKEVRLPMEPEKTRVQAQS